MSNLIGKVALAFGVLAFLYPYMHNQQWFNPYINILMGILGMGFGLGLIGDYYEKMQTELKREKEKLEAIYKSSQDISFIITEPIDENKDALIKEFSPGAENIFAYSKEEVLNKSVSLLHSNSEIKKFPNIHEKIAKDEVWQEEVELVRKSGEKFPALFTAYPLKYQKDKFRTLGVAIDISELKKTKLKLQNTKKQLEAILESIQDGISVLNSDLTIQYTNWAMQNWYEENLPLKGKKCYKAYHNRDKPCSNCPTIKCLKTGEVEKEIIPLEESKIDYVELFSYPMFNEKTGEVEGVVEFVRDISERKRQEEKIRYISYHDELTDLYNRSYIEEEIARLDTKRQLPMSIIIADVNGLKIINDTYGHSTGDKVLVKVADILRETMRDEDIISRYGGDEFLILLPQTEKKSANQIAKRLKKNFKNIKLNRIDISLAIGIATKIKSEQEIYDIIEEADDNMYQNKLTEKRSSKNKIVKGLLNTLSAKSEETKEHAIRMTDYAFKLGEKINLTTEQLNNLSLLATLHDIGKVTIPENILTKADKLNKKEWKLMKKHTKKGYTIATATEEFAPIAKSILSHHERWDGTGYPQGLSQKEIPLLARVITIVDAYDVMTSGRPYKDPISKKEAIKELKRCAGSQFDPKLVKEFVEIIND